MTLFSGRNLSLGQKVTSLGVLLGLFVTLGQNITCFTTFTLLLRTFTPESPIKRLGN